MSNPLPPGYVIPNPGPIKVIGVLNIIFATLLLLYEACQGAAILLMPMFTTMIQTQQKQLQSQQEVQWRAKIQKQLAELDAEEKAAKTEEEKAKIQAERAQIKASKPYTPNMLIGMDVAQDPVVKVYNFAELITGAILNVAMLISGIALLRFREWGRRLALWVAGLKMARLATLIVVGLMVVTPRIMKQINVQMEQMNAQIQQANPGKPIPPQVKSVQKMTGAFSAASYVGFYGAGLIYPTIMIWVLTRPRNKAACMAQAHKPVSDPWS